MTLKRLHLPGLQEGRWPSFQRGGSFYVKSGPTVSRQHTAETGGGGMPVAGNGKFSAVNDTKSDSGSVS